MDLKDKTILILGGSGLVGEAVARRVIPRRPKRIVLVALYEDETEEAVQLIGAEAGDVEIESTWGNIFLPADAARMSYRDALAKDKLRELIIGDLLGDLTEEVLQRSFLFQVFQRFKPHAVVDCINTATAFAYQDVFTSARELVAAARRDAVSRSQVEAHVLTLTTPQLIRHVQVMLEAMRVAGTQAYVKIGTSGTGGMGLNIPYTHSEEKPSRTLLGKSAVAGAHSLLMFLMGRTPGAPAIVEIKPTAAIAWREIGYGTIRRKRDPIRKYDCPNPLSCDTALRDDASGWIDLGSSLESVFIDAGENGLFARDEFETVTALGQMEFITPEEVADYVMMELEGRPTGRDVIAALDSATAGPTYHAGIIRASAIERLKELEKEHGVRAVAFEMLGPPRLTKLLYEAFICSKLKASVRDLAESDAESLSAEALQLVARDAELRSLIVSVGLPILIPGEKLYRGGVMIVPALNGDVDRAASQGWVDLRVANCGRWIGRAGRVVAQAQNRRIGSGSSIDWGAMRADDPITPSGFATWIFRNEDGAERIKR